jgi:endonuclease V-like protein UPF0215 family
MPQPSNKLFAVGVDDGYFPLEYKGGKGETILLAVATLKTHVIVGLAYGRIPVDSPLVTRSIAELTRLLSPRLVFLDGITYAGFGVADPRKISDMTGATVVTIQQYPLDLNRIRRALQKHFDDHRERFAVIKTIYSSMRILSTPWRTIKYYAYPPGSIEPEEIRKYMIYSPIPEPLRLAHLIASETSKYLHSKGYL